MYINEFSSILVNFKLGFITLILTLEVVLSKVKLNIVLTFVEAYHLKWNY